jgi:hypothetical protein
MSLIRVLSAVLCLLLAPILAGAAEKPSGAQKRAASEYLDAVASGSPQAVAYAIHPAELEELRTKVLTQLRDEAAKGDSTVRVRLFGRGKPLPEIERMTAIDFYVALGPKLYLFGREYKDADWIAAIPDKDDVVQVVLRGKPEKERGQPTAEVVNVVSIRPYGKDWKATLPTEIEAQIDDLIYARRNIYARLPPPAPGPSAPRPGSASGETGIPPAITTLLNDASKALAVPNCEDYYNKYMSPNFRKVTSKGAGSAHQQLQDEHGHARDAGGHGENRERPRAQLRVRGAQGGVRRERAGAAVRSVRDRAGGPEVVHRGVIAPP